MCGVHGYQPHIAGNTETAQQGGSLFAFLVREIDAGFFPLPGDSQRSKQGSLGCGGIQICFLRGRKIVQAEFRPCGRKGQAGFRSAQGAEEGKHTTARQLLAIHNEIETARCGPAAPGKLSRKTVQAALVQSEEGIHMRIAFQQRNTFGFSEQGHAGLRPAALKQFQQRRGQQYVPDLTLLADEDIAGRLALWGRMIHVAFSR